MILLSVFLFVIAVLLVAVGACITAGNYDLIYDYYISSVNDLKGYTRDHGIAMMCTAIPFLVCGILQLLEPQLLLTLIGIGIFVVGIIACYVAFYQIQKKYNGGMF